MKLRFALTGILGCAICISNALLATPVKMLILKQVPSIREIEEYTTDTAHTISQVAKSILSIAAEDHTYENTLGSWNQLLAQLSQHFQTLQAVAESNSPSSTTASEAIEHLHAFQLQTLHHTSLYEILTEYSQKILQDTKSSPFHCYVATCFINNAWYQPLHLLGASREERSPELDYTLFNPDATDSVKIVDLLGFVA